MKILLFGDRGCFGTAMSHACMLRNLNYHGLSRQDVDILDDSAIENVIRSHEPSYENISMASPAVQAIPS